MVSIADELRVALANEPGFPPASVGDRDERDRLVVAFEADVGLEMPPHFRAFLVDLGLFGIAPRLFSASHSSRKLAHSSSAVIANAHQIASFYETVIEDNLDACDTEEQRDWVSRLVPVILDNNDEYFLLDFSFNPGDPPLVSIRDELPWFAGRARFVAPSLLEYLRYPIWDSSAPPNDLVDEPTEAAKEWTKWFEALGGVS